MQQLAAQFRWRVVETPCYPRCWKVWRGLEGAGANMISNFFADKEKAEREADRRNEVEKWA